MRIVLATALLALLSVCPSGSVPVIRKELVTKWHSPLIEARSAVVGPSKPEEEEPSLSVESENVLLALKSAVQSLQTNAGSESAGIYAQLVRIFRATSKDDLLNVYEQIKIGGDVKDNNLAKKLFLDSLLRAGTADSIEVAIELLKSRQLSDFEQKLVFLSLGNARHASSDAVAAAAVSMPYIN